MEVLWLDEIERLIPQAARDEQGELRDRLVAEVPRLVRAVRGLMDALDWMLEVVREFVDSQELAALYLRCKTTLERCRRGDI